MTFHCAHCGKSIQHTADICVSCCRLVIDAQEAIFGYREQMVEIERKLAPFQEFVNGVQANVNRERERRRQSALRN